MSKKHAVLIGNTSYDMSDLDLDTPINDISVIEESLVQRGFSINKYINATLSDLDNVLTTLAECEDKEFIFIYYSGHAIEINGRGYLLPVDLMDMQPYCIANYTCPVEKILDYLKDLKATKVIVLDSCRNGIDGWVTDDYNRFASIVADSSTIMDYANVAIAYSTSSGAKAYDGEKTSLYAKYLSEYILKHRINIDDVFKNIGVKVTNESPYNQRPWFYSSLHESTTFSDLPEYEFIHSLKTPVSGNNITLSSLNGQHIVNGGKHTAYAVNGLDCERCIGLDDECIMGVSYSEATGFVVATELGGLIGNDFSVVPEFDNTQLISLKVSADGRYIVLLSTSAFLIIYNDRNKLKKIRETSGSFYTAEFIDESTLWIGTDYGVLSIELTDGIACVKNNEIKTVHYVYAIMPMDSCSVLISCADGYVLLVDRFTLNVKNKISLGKTVRTVSSRRDCVINITTDNQTLHEFIYTPWNIEAEGFQYLKGELSSNNLLFIAKSPIDPIVVIGSDEGVLYFIDSRSFIFYHSIVVTTTNNKIYGVSFDEDGNILVLLFDGFVNYYYRGSNSYRQAIEYIDAN